VELNSYIKDLLILNENIIVKGFGAFEKVMESAVIDEKSGEIQPPHMTIKFDDSLKVDSGTLTKYISEKEKISENEAVKKIEASVKKWEEELKSGKLVELEGIGNISQDKAGIKKFEPKIQPGTFPDMYGLPVLTVEEQSQTQQKTQTKESTKKNIPEKKKVAEKRKSTLQQKRPVKKVKQPVKKTITGQDGEKRAKKVLLTALIIVPIIILIIFGALNFDLVKEKFSSSSEYVSNLLSGNEMDTQTDVADVDSNKVSDTNELDSTQNQTEAVLENFTIINAETNQSVPAVAENLTQFNRVEIIAGSFRIKRYAKRLRNQLNNKGFTAKVLPRSNGLYRVSVGSFNDVEQAAKEIENIQELDPSINVWVLLNK